MNKNVFKASLNKTQHKTLKENHSSDYFLLMEGQNIVSRTLLGRNQAKGDTGYICIVNLTVFTC